MSYSVTQLIYIGGVHAPNGNSTTMIPVPIPGMFIRTAPVVEFRSPPTPILVVALPVCPGRLLMYNDILLSQRYAKAAGTFALLLVTRKVVAIINIPTIIALRLFFTIKFSIRKVLFKLYEFTMAYIKGL